MTPSNRRKHDDRARPAAGPACPSCGAARPKDARFCHACGAPFKGGPGGAARTAGRWAGLGAAAGVSAIAVFAAMKLSERDAAPPPPSPAAPMPLFDAPPAASPGAPPDLSRMTPRAAADRLFNRIMMASERGDRAEALRFVPMAVAAYDGLATLDRDAHYHLGLIHDVAGDRARVERQIAALRRGAPNHLLALVLEHDAAARAGDRAAAARSLAAFAAAYDAEMAAGRPEYEAHRNAIERFRARAAARGPSSAAAPAGAARNGTALFAAKCAGCHGTAAVGSDKGPPLVHKIYEPSHHGDDSFHRAVRRGVRPHHWKFGAMPPVPGVSDAEVERIIAYVRALQRAAGIR